MSASFTKGPWRVIGDGKYSPDLRITSDKRRDIGIVYSDGLVADQANARLIAAAPDLLAELEALVTAVCFADPPKLFSGVECHEARVPVEFVKAARDAIAKAVQS